MYFVAIAALLVLVVNGTPQRKEDGKPAPFEFEWRSFADIAAAMKSPRPAVQTSLGAVTYTREAPVMQHEVLLGSDAAHRVSSVLVYSAVTNTASVSFTQGTSNVQLLATPTTFNVSRFSPDNITDDAEDDHSHADDNEDDSAEKKEVAGRRFRASDDYSRDAQRPEVRRYEGDGTVYGARTDLPFLRNYRLVYGIGPNEYRDLGNTDTALEALCIRLTAEMNKYMERDLGIHFTYVGVAKSDKDIFRAKGKGGLDDVTPYFSSYFGQDNYDIGVYLTEVRPERRNGNGLGKAGGTYEQRAKGGCAIYWPSGFYTHEAGHLFGPFHPHEGVNFEPGHGFTIMSYTASVYNAFNLGSMIASTVWLDNTRFVQDTEQFYPVENSNMAPQVNESRYKSEYHIGPSTAFRFTMDANDPDEGDDLVYYVQQLNYNTSRNAGYDILKKQQTFLYQMNLTGLPMFVTPDVTKNRTFYFQSFNDPDIFQYNTLLDKTALENYVNDSSLKKEGKISYDMFLTAIDTNTAKRNAYFEEFDPIVQKYTKMMIAAHNMTNLSDEQRKQKSKELETEMKTKLAAIQAKPWINRRGHVHVKVIAHKDYEPLTLTMHPKKEEYTAGENVKLTWTYDTRTIPDTDHVNIRLSVDKKVSYPYLLAQNIRVNQKELNITMPYISASEATAYDRKAYKAIKIPNGFLMIEHVEGIVFAPSYNNDKYKGIEGNEGGFKITVPQGEQQVTQYAFQPSGSAIISTMQQLEEAIKALGVFDLSKKNEKVEDSRVRYVFAAPNGTIIKNYESKPTNYAELLQYMNGTNAFYKLAAVVGSASGNIHVGKTLSEMQAENGQHGKPFVTEAVEFKVFAPNVTRPPIPQTYYFINVNPKNALFISKGKEHYLAKTGIPIGSNGMDYHFKDEGNTTIVYVDNASDEDSGTTDEDSGSTTGEDSGSTTDEDSGSTTGEDSGGTTGEDSGSGTTEGAVIEVSNDCDDSTCSSCSQRQEYIADGECRAVPKGATSDGRYYRASTCTGESDEELVIKLFNTHECSGEGQKMSLSKSCMQT